MKSNLFHILFLLILIQGIHLKGFAQSAPPQKGDPLQQYFYPPELVMQNQTQLNLSGDQKEKILTILDDSQSKFNRWHWELQSKTEGLQKIIEQDSVDEQAALNQIEEILQLEKSIKKNPNVSDDSD